MNLSENWKDAILKVKASLSYLNDSPEDNIEAAMEKVAANTSMGRRSNTGSKPGEPAQKQVIIRTSDRNHERWKEAAEIQGVSLAEFIRALADAEATRLLECTHPEQFVVRYPWIVKCKKCGERLDK
jgi:predicted HicB family RNase H-like nuclease